MRPVIPFPGRQEPRELAELRALRVAQPELASAIDIQIELVTLQRRIQVRVPTPVVPLTPDAAAARLASGRRLLDFDAIPLDWSDARLALRQTADAFHRHDSLDEADHAAIMTLVHEAGRFEQILRTWYAATGKPGAAGPSRQVATEPVVLDQLLSAALRPFFARATEALCQRIELSTWQRPSCPVCGAEPEFAAILADETRLLTCGRCEARWPWDATGCVYCGLSDRARLPTFTSPDRRYRIYACDSCRRYLKAYDTRGARRPVLPMVDVIATLPLDAAAIQQGYRSDV
jgi:ribosomal protein L40E